ncbi:MAG: hypothetical protein ACI8ZM_002429 [Crocinitomix sp.]|jgi:hypothetical protein
MKNLKTILCLLLLSSLTFSCNKKIDNIKTLKDLHKIYESGQMLECTHNGETVYSCGPNVYDSGGVIYDKDGEVIGSCNFAWGTSDPICGELEECEVIYLSADNIWGQPHIDKYNLGD